MSPRRRKLLKWLLGSLVALTVVIGLLFVAFGYVVGRVPEYRVQLQDWINERSGLIVEFRTLRARLRFYGPELVFDDAVLRTPDRTAVLATARRGSVGFDLWNSIGSGRLRAGRFSLESPEIGLIRTREGRIQLLGQSSLPERDQPFALEQLPTGQFHVDDAVVSFRDEITGRGPWSLSGVSFDLTRDSDSMRLRGTASLPKSLGHELEFGATAQGPLEEYATLVSTFTLEGSQLDLGGWADVLPDEWPAPETGHGSLRLSGAMRGPELTQLSAEVDFANVAGMLPSWTTPLPQAEPLRPLQSDDADNGAGNTVQPAQQAEAPPVDVEPAAEPLATSPPAVLSYDRVAFRVRAQKVAGAWSASLSDLELARQHSVWKSKQIEAKWSRTPQGAIKASGKADSIVVESLWPLLAYAPESVGLARLRALDASGTVQDLSGSYERAAADAAPTYSLQAQLHSFAFKPIGRTPGFSGLSGEVRASEQAGSWKLAASDVHFELPRLFRNALVARSVEGTIGWNRIDGTERGWNIGSEEMRVNTDDGNAIARFTATVPGDGTSTLLDLSAQAQDLNVAATARYIPAGRLGAKTIEWFDHAFVDGRVTSAQLVLKGPTQAFPFRKDEGTFLARGQVENAVFNYQPGWTPATAVMANVEFHNEGMHIRCTGARVGELRVAAAIADIADLKDTNLVIEASASGDLGAGLQFLKQSPLGPRLGERFARLNGQGPMNASVHLHLPIRHMDDREIDVTSRFSEATAWLQNVDAPVRQLAGTLTVKNTLIAAADLTGVWLGGPLEVTVQPEGKSASVLNAKGEATAAMLQPVLGLPSMVRLSGATDWRLSTKFLASDGSEADETRTRSVRIDSDLKGLGVALPAPVGKSEAEARPLQLSLELIGDDNVLARGSLGEVRSLIRVRRYNTGWGLDRGGLRADGVAASLPDHSGLRIEGSLDRFVLDDWLALRGTDNAAGTGKPLSEYLQAANVRIGEFRLFGYRWPDVRGILQATPAGWRVDVTGPAAEGQVLIPEAFTGAQPLRATLDHLIIERADAAADASKDDGTPIDPRNFPNLQVYVADLRLGARKIGAVDLKASRVPEGIRFDTASVAGESVRAEGQGEWLVRADGQHSSLSATVRSSDVAATLRALDYTEFLQAKQGEIRANISWPGGFSGNILQHASGGLSVHAESGQLVNLQPGAGRVLGLFSVAALPRRLALDFSDLTEKGLAFDTVHGDFELRDGNAYTNNLTLRGPAAEIGIAGRTGLGTRDYDQTAVVTGNLGASLPVAGALAGGPAVGAALLLFSQVFKEPLKGITRGYYRITGPWDEPIVERVEASDVKAEVNRESVPEVVKQ